MIPNTVTNFGVDQDDNTISFAYRPTSVRHRRNSGVDTKGTGTITLTKSEI